MTAMQTASGTLAASTRPYTVTVTSASVAARPAAERLAGSLGLAFHERPPADADLHLLQTEQRLELHDPASGARLWVEFTRAEIQRYRAGGAGGDPLRRAVGPGRRYVADASGGLGRDAVHLAALGYDVTAIERNAVVAALACDGLARARSQGLLAADNPRWYTGDGRTLLATLDPRPATVYLDPMFPPKRKKSAAVRKEMRLLRLLAGEDGDVLELFAAARRAAAERVVVKRPLEAAPIVPAPSAVYRGKLVRYDVYRTSGPRV
jgi:16S rRNA (guanine1516-N2)-methyltransferase